MAQINIKTSLTDKTLTFISITDLYTDLTKDLTKPKSYYEWYDSNKIDFIKPVIDIDIVKRTDKQLKGIDDEDVIEKTKTAMKKIFGDDINVIYSTDHRRYRKIGKSYDESKKSYHFIINNKKINPKVLGKIMRKNKNEFKDYKIDTSIYRNGENKFRLPLTAKETETRTKRKKNLFMKMEGEQTEQNFNNFCLTLTEGLDELNIEIEEEKVEKKEEENLYEDDDVLKNIKFVKLSLKPLEQVLKKYNVIKSVFKNEVYIYFNLEGDYCPCGETHTNNHQYLILDILDNSLSLGCHSKNCKEKELLLKNIYRRLSEFNLTIFMKLKQYHLQKKYLEKRVIFLSDTGGHKQIKYRRDNTVEIGEISFSVIANCITEFTNQDGEVKSTKFGLRYLTDEHKKIYKDTIFYPKEEMDEFYENYFNEFQGLGYKRVLPYHIDKDKVYEEQKENIIKYLNFLLKYVCNNDKAVLHFFISFLSSYVKYPEKLNHMILVLYSLEQGTGKSSLTDFIFKIIGETYTANADIEQITDKHSNLCHKKIINLIEELSYIKGQDHAKKLKNKCQAKTLTLNEKCKSMIQIDNFCHFIITMNEHNALPLEPNDRRHFVLEFTKIYNNLQLITYIEELYDNDEFTYSFGRYLNEYQEDWDFSSPKEWEKNRPMTELFKLMIKRDSIDKFFNNLLNYKFHNESSISNLENYNYYISGILEEFIIDGDKDILIKKNNLYDLYYDKNENNIKTQKESFYSKLTDIKKFCIKKDYKDEKYYKIDFYKLQKHLKLSNKDMKLEKMLRIIKDEKKPEKIKMKEVDELLKK